MAPESPRERTHLVDAAEGGHVHRLPPHDAGRAHAGRVLARAGVDDGVHHHLCSWSECGWGVWSLIFFKDNGLGGWLVGIWFVDDGVHHRVVGWLEFGWLSGLVGVLCVFRHLDFVVDWAGCSVQSIIHDRPTNPSLTQPLKPPTRPSIPVPTDRPQLRACG